MTATSRQLFVHPLFGMLCLWALLLLPFAVTLWCWSCVPGLPTHVLSGALFRSSWWVGHAGFCLDRPTIGKWYFWATIFGGAWCFSAFFASRFCRRLTLPVRRVYALATLTAGGFYLCLLSLPFTWTLQYIRAMGPTPHRLIALAWGLVGYSILIALSCLFVRQALEPQQTANSGAGNARAPKTRSEP